LLRGGAINRMETIVSVKYINASMLAFISNSEVLNSVRLLFERLHTCGASAVAVKVTDAY